MSDEILDAANQSEGDTKEGIYFGPEIALDDPDAALPLHGPNQWPDPVRFARLHCACHRLFNTECLHTS